jgi:hypothetical protein
MMTQQGILFGCAAFLAIVALAPPHQDGSTQDAKIKRAMALKGAMAVAVGILVAIAASIR